jgi:hypothetical protein
VCIYLVEGDLNILTINYAGICICSKIGILCILFSVYIVCIHFSSLHLIVSKTELQFTLVFWTSIIMRNVQMKPAFGTASEYSQSQAVTWLWARYTSGHLAGRYWNIPHVVQNCSGVSSCVWPWQSFKGLWIHGWMKASRPWRCFFAEGIHHQVCQWDGWFVTVGTVFNGVLQKSPQVVSFQQAFYIYIPSVSLLVTRFSV